MTEQTKKTAIQRLKDAFNATRKKSVLTTAAVVTALSLAFNVAAAPLAYAHHMPADKTVDYSIARADSALVMDADTGKVLYSSHADDLRYPASLTKIMTLYLTFDALEKGLIKESDMMSVSAHAESMPPTDLNLHAGDRISVHDAIVSLMVRSANDSAVVLAEHLADIYGYPKSERLFAQVMTTTARNLGMTHTTFVNASGLFDARQVTTANDMAILAKAYIDRFEDPKRGDDPYDMFMTPSFKWKGKTYYNHNHLLKMIGAEGMKTGYVRASGFNIVATLQHHGKRYIGIVFGGESSHKRDVKMAELFRKYLPEDAPRPKAEPARQKTPKAPLPGGAHLS